MLEMDNFVKVICPKCRTFYIENILQYVGEELRLVTEYSNDIHPLISRETSNYADAGQPLRLTRSGIKAIESGTYLPKTIPAAGDYILSYVSKHQKQFSDSISISQEKDFFLLRCKSKRELQEVISYLIESEFIKNTGSEDSYFIQPNLKIYLTAKGSERAYEVQKKDTKYNLCFVAMWFDESLEDAYTLGIEAAIRETTILEPLRVDKAEHNDDINDFIIASLRQSALVVADFTGNRSGVYFEAGFGFGAGITVIYTCLDENRHTDLLHFDTEHRNHIFWKNPEDLRVRLINRIRATLPPQYLKSF
jgi:hypothetical protein